MTIVCATHFTDSSFGAVKVAAGLARRHRQPLWLVSVLPDRAASDEGQEAVNDALLLEAAALTTEGLDVRTTVLNGPIDRTVSEFCVEKKALLLVIGDTSKNTNRMFAGTLDKFAYGTELPLLVVRDFKPLEAWTNGKAPLKVMLALDHTWSSVVARDWISRLAEYGPLDLVAAHIWWPEDEYARRGISPPPAEEGHASLSKAMQDETANALKALPSNVSCRVHLEMGKGHIGEQLLALAADELVEVLVLGTNPHHGPISLARSVSHDVLMNAPMSVACVPGRLQVPAFSTLTLAMAANQVGALAR
ncbi:MAG: Universal stress protein [Myxococcaceae bacterium]|nr:Universal stress protein [Myxococcaceae bacterium]